MSAFENVLIAQHDLETKPVGSTNSYTILHMHNIKIEDTREQNYLKLKIALSIVFVASMLGIAIYLSEIKWTV
jgi:hypothetical protein